MHTYDLGKYAADQQKMRITYVTTRMPLDNILARWPSGGHGGRLVVAGAAIRGFDLLDCASPPEEPAHSLV